MNLSQLETAVADELGLDTTNEKATIDVAINQAVQRVLEDTHCYVKRTDYSDWDGTSDDYTLDSAILDIVEVQITSGGLTYPMERLSVIDLLERRREGATAASQTAKYYAMSGANLLMFYPPPGAADTLAVYLIPVPTALSASGDDPSTDANGGVPAILHEGIFLYACSKLASYDDDQSSAQGQRYRDWYKEEITRYRTLMRKRGGTRNARIIVNGKHAPRIPHSNSVYPPAL